MGGQCCGADHPSATDGRRRTHLDRTFKPWSVPRVKSRRPIQQSANASECERPGRTAARRGAWRRAAGQATDRGWGPWATPPRPRHRCRKRLCGPGDAVARSLRRLTLPFGSSAAAWRRAVAHIATETTTGASTELGREPYAAGSRLSALRSRSSCCVLFDEPSATRPTTPGDRVATVRKAPRVVRAQGFIHRRCQIDAAGEEFPVPSE